MGSKKAPTTTASTTTTLDPNAQKIADLAFPFAQQYASTDLNLPAPQIAGFNANEIAGQNSALAAATGPMQQQVTNAAASNDFLMNPALLDPSTNPYLQAQGDVIQRQGQQQFLEGILPGLRSGSVVTGGFYGGGNTRQAIAQGQAAERVGGQVANALTNLYGNAYQQGLGTIGAAVDRSGTVAKNLAMPGTVQAGVGAQQRGMKQTNLDATSAYDWIKQQLPFIKANQLYSLVGAMPGATTTSTATGALPQTGGVSGALGGAATGASIGSIIPGVGTGVGALLGGIGGWFT